MTENRCGCYYDAALHKQSTNCPLHDPYIRCEDLEAENAQLRERIAELENEKADTDHLFDLQWKSDMRAIEMWQQATGRKLTWPDRADLSVWLMTELAQRDAEIERLKTMSTVEMMCENMNVNHHVTEWEERCLKAEVEIVELRKDRARLEWVIEHKATLYHIDEGWCCEWQSSRFIEDADCDIEEPRDTPREAIDSAIEDFASEDAAIAAAEVKGDK